MTGFGHNHAARPASFGSDFSHLLTCNMTSLTTDRRSKPGGWDLDPRRSLAAGAMWLIIALAVTFSTAAAVWVGSIARRDVFEQHVRRLSLETDQLSSELGQAIAARLG